MPKLRQKTEPRFFFFFGHHRAFDVIGVFFSEGLGELGLEIEDGREEKQTMGRWGLKEWFAGGGGGE